METTIQFRCKKEFKDDAEKKAKSKGFSNVSEYIRHLIKNDKN